MYTSHSAAWFAELLEYRVSQMNPREKVIAIKFTRASARLLAENLRRAAKAQGTLAKM